MNKIYKLFLYPRRIGGYVCIAPDFPGLFDVFETPAAAIRFAKQWIITEYQRTGSLPEPSDAYCKSPGCLVHYIVIQDK